MERVARYSSKDQRHHHFPAICKPLVVPIRAKNHIITGRASTSGYREIVSGDLETLSRYLETPSMIMETPSMIQEIASRDLETTSRVLEMTSRDLETISRVQETTSRDQETIYKVMEATYKVMEAKVARFLTSVGNDGLMLNRGERGKRWRQSRPLLPYFILRGTVIPTERRNLFILSL